MCILLAHNEMTPFSWKSNCLTGPSPALYEVYRDNSVPKKLETRPNSLPVHRSSCALSNASVVTGDGNACGAGGESSSRPTCRVPLLVFKTLADSDWTMRDKIWYREMLPQPVT